MNLTVTDQNEHNYTDSNSKSPFCTHFENKIKVTILVTEGSKGK